MARETLPVALSLMFGHEGGYSNAKTDSGGPTRWGVTHKTLASHRGVPSVTAAQVKAMTIEEATDIYRRSYWSQSGGDLLPIGLDYAAFDFGVNSGPATAVKKLQKVLGVRVDGHAGEATAEAAKTYPGGIQKLIRDYCDERMRYLRSLGGKQGFSANGRGWTIRVTGQDPKGEWKSQPGVVGNAVRLATTARSSAFEQTAPPVPISAPPEAQAKADVKSTGLPAILSKPEAALPAAGGLLTALSSFSPQGPIAWAVALCGVAVVAVGIWYFVSRVREGK